MDVDDQRTSDGGAGADHVDDLLDRHRTGELPPADAARVEEHLEACPRCSAALADLESLDRTVSRGYAAIRAAAPEPDWAARRSAIVERTSARRRGGLAGLREYAPQAAAVAVALLAVGVLVERGVRGPADAERIVRQEPEAGFELDDPMPAEKSEIAAPPSPSAVEEDDGRAEDGRRRGDAVAARGDRAGEVNARIARRPAPGEDRIAAEAAAPSDEALEERENAVEGAPGRRAGEEAEPEDVALDAITVSPEARKAAPPVERFRDQARRALAASDTVAATAALGLWSDSVDQDAVAPSDVAALQALADSLRALLRVAP